MIRPPPRSTLFPYPTLFRSPAASCWASNPQRWIDIKRNQCPGVPHGHYCPQRSQASFRRRPLSLATKWRLRDRKSTRLNSSHSQISYAVFCLKKKKTEEIDRTSQFCSPHPAPVTMTTFACTHRTYPHARPHL